MPFFSPAQSAAFQYDSMRGLLDGAAGLLRDSASDRPGDKKLQDWARASSAATEALGRAAAGGFANVVDIGPVVALKVGSVPAGGPGADTVSNAGTATTDYYLTPTGLWWMVDSDPITGAKTPTPTHVHHLTQTLGADAVVGLLAQVGPQPTGLAVTRQTGPAAH